MVFSLFGPSKKATPKRVKELLYKDQDGRCMYCGRKFAIHYLHIDHKIPTTRHGSNRTTNKQLLCSRCNTRKGKKTDGEFRRQYPFLKSAREAKGPPSRPIPDSRFEERDKELKKRRK